MNFLNHYPLNEKQKEAVAKDCLDQDTVVVAGAGTGKTRTLVARYLAYLEDSKEKIDLRSILAITFTKKAAREMRSRVRETIGSLLESDLGEKEKERWKNYYQELDSARISTIHSLCSEILRTHPAEAAVDPLFDLLEEGESRHWQALLLDQTIEQAAADSIYDQLFVVLGESGIRIYLTELMKRRGESLEAFEKVAGVDLYQLWEENLIAAQEEAYLLLRENEEWIDSLSAIRAFKPIEGFDDVVMGNYRIANRALKKGARFAEQLPYLNRLPEIKLNGRRKGKVGEVGFEEMKVGLKGVRDLWKKHPTYPINDIFELRLNEHDRTAAQLLPLLGSLFKFYYNRYEALKDRENRLDYDDLELKTVQLFEENQEILDYWQEGVGAILLVDEFQDTNPIQFQLIKLLNGEREKLFVVGDGKQSIYRFRGANVQMFRDLQNRSNSLEGGSKERRLVKLDISYRTHASLLSDMNALLKPVLGADDDEMRDWQERFSALRANEDVTCVTPLFEGADVEFHTVLGNKDEAAFLAARALAVRLKQLNEQYKGDIWGDVAILCRSANSFIYYEDAFEEAGVPYITVAGKGFYERPEIRELLTILRAIVDKRDDVALTGLLRAHSYAFSDFQLFEWHQKKRNQKEKSLWAVIVQEGENDESVARVITFINKFEKLAGRMPISQLLQHILTHSGYRAAFLKNEYGRAANNINRLVGIAQESEISSVGRFLELLDDQIDLGVQMSEAPSVSTGAIQIMTIHKAKGLEFSIVVIGDAGKQLEVMTQLPLVGGKNLISLPIKEESDGGTVVAASYRIAKQVDKDQERVESNRVLYVAATRAIQKLIFNGHIRKFNKNGDPFLTGWFKLLNESGGVALNREEIDFGGRFPQMIPLGSDGEREAAFYYYDEGKEIEPVKIEKMEDDGTEPGYQNKILSWESGERKRFDLDRLRAEWREETYDLAGSLVGTLVHDWIALERPLGDEYQSWAREQLKGKELSLSLREGEVEMIERSELLLGRYYESVWYEKICQATEWRHELPYIIKEDGRVVERRIDLFALIDDVWWVIDFKTNRLSGNEDLSEWVREMGYDRQLAGYVAGVKQFIGQIEVKSLLLLLDYGGAVNGVSV